MSDQKTVIARKYLLPERPFLHGITSAFDVFGVLNRGRLEYIRNRARSKTRQSDLESLRLLWQEVGDTLLLAVDKYEQECSEENTA